jgi:hypothetical protein
VHFVEERDVIVAQGDAHHAELSGCSELRRVNLHLVATVFADACNA